MDTGNGYFEMGNDLQELEEMAKRITNSGGIFTVGEKVELRGSLFRIKSIKPNELRLKLLKRKND